MATPIPSPPEVLPFEECVRLVDEANPSLDATMRDLVVSLMMIREFRDLLYADETNLASGIPLTFAEKVMKAGFDRIIKYLRDFRGGDRRGVLEALGSMNDALSNLYAVIITLSDETKKDTFEYGKARVDAFLLCRGHLQKAYEQLEHLAAYLPKRSTKNE